MNDPHIRIETFGGNCPVQAEGFVDDKPFYFRARGEHWTMGIGGDPVCNPEWFLEECYGEGPFDAGWMPQYEALGFLAKAIGLYAEHNDCEEAA
jgi:hypothetical protein